MKAQKNKLIVQPSASLTGFQNDLTEDPITNDQKEWNFIPFPSTSRKICVSRSGFKLNLCPCPKEQQKSWATQFPKMAKPTTQHWQKFHTQLGHHCSLHRVHVPPMDETRMCNNPRGFIVGAHEDGSDVDFPTKHQSHLHCCSKQLHHASIKEGVLPTTPSSAIKCCQNCD